ncbi:MAG: 5-deoxy-glucuronate isomerase [Actinomycetota bacterium]|nr:5-deoxy-glucuronate isomerase [Actinomycetota bacterium]
MTSGADGARPPQLLFRSGEWASITPESAGWRYLTFAVEKLGPGEALEDATHGEEVALVLLSGHVEASADGDVWELGPRPGVFEALPWTLYLPRDTAFRVEALAVSELAVARAPCERRREPLLQRPEQVDVEVRGAGNATRQINNMIQPGFPAERVLVVEVLTPAGNWSSYPPHKHDEDRPPEEVVLEEIYYYRAPAPAAFGVQRLYGGERGLDLTATVRDGDLLLVPFGYHPFCAAPGYDFYYLNALAGDRHSMAASDDPALAWVRGSWPSLEKDARVPLVTRDGRRTAA